ncbi:hypothetical protein PMAYCL1PPCAC_32828, partial [Pristionchus mayeri]
LLSLLLELASLLVVEELGGLFLLVSLFGGEHGGLGFGHLRRFGLLLWRGSGTGGLGLLNGSGLGLGLGLFGLGLLLGLLLCDFLLNLLLGVLFLFVGHGCEWGIR